MGLTKLLLHENFRNDYNKDQELDFLYHEFQHEQEKKKAQETLKICRTERREHEV